MQLITLVNPHEGVAWKRHLDWLLNNRPNAVRKLFKENRLESHLDNFVATVVVHRSTLQRAGKTREEAEYILANRLLNNMGRNGMEIPCEDELIEKIVTTLTRDRLTRTVTIAVGEAL